MEEIHSPHSKWPRKKEQGREGMCPITHFKATASVTRRCPSRSLSSSFLSLPECQPGDVTHTWSSEEQHSSEPQHRPSQAPALDTESTRTQAQ